MTLKLKAEAADLSSAIVEAVDRLYDSDRLLREIQDMQEKILRREIERRKVTEEAERTEEARKSWISHQELSIALEVNGDGKPAFRNESQRKAELERRKQDPEEKNVETGECYHTVEVRARAAQYALEDFDRQTKSLENRIAIRWMALRMMAAKLTAIGNLQF